ncbi:MAG: hypothetical protein EP347_00325 [Alphaproteobacteria bacterium]|nr:MAG: hypothetical protein EP347_00325 [Alphaproteobacteria bacterium]
MKKFYEAVEELTNRWPEQEVSILGAKYGGGSDWDITANFIEPKSGLKFSISADDSDTCFFEVSAETEDEAKLVLLSEIWEIDMNYLPTGEKVESPTAFGDFIISRISEFLFSEFIILIDVGLFGYKTIWIRKSKLELEITNVQKFRWRAVPKEKYICYLYQPPKPGLT